MTCYVYVCMYAYVCYIGYNTRASGGILRLSGVGGGGINLPNH